MDIGVDRVGVVKVMRRRCRRRTGWDWTERRVGEGRRGAWKEQGAGSRAKGKDNGDIVPGSAA